MVSFLEEGVYPSDDDSRQEGLFEGLTEQPCPCDGVAHFYMTDSAIRSTLTQTQYLYPIEKDPIECYIMDDIEKIIDCGDKGKPIERWGRKATGLRFKSGLR